MVVWRQLVTCSFRVQLCPQKLYINIQACYIRGNHFARYKSKMADENETITFNSRSKSPYDKFSNFYEVQLKMPEGVFGSVEHYFQAMKFVDKNHSRFEVNGDLGKRKFDSSSWKDSVTRARFIKSAGGKAGTQKYKLTLRKNGLDRERAQQKMKDGLRTKFETEPFRSLLLKTGTRKLVHTPMRGKTDYWTGRVDKTSGDITGENNMGKLLMEVRQELQGVEESSKNEENDDIKDEKEISGDDKKGEIDLDDGIEEGNEPVGDKKDEAKDDDDNGDAKDENKDDVDRKDDDDNMDENKDDGDRKVDDDNKGENKDDGDGKDDDDNMSGDEVREDGVKRDDIVKQDNKSTTSETKDSSGSRGKKRKHEEDEVQEEHLDDEVPKGPDTKRKKIEVESGSVRKQRE